MMMMMIMVMIESTRFVSFGRVEKLALGRVLIAWCIAPSYTVKMLFAYLCVWAWAIQKQRQEVQCV